eukprot:479617-Amphidinium_carterae.1
MVKYRRLVMVRTSKLQKPLRRAPSATSSWSAVQTIGNYKSKNDCPRLEVISLCDVHPRFKLVQLGPKLM